MEINNLNIEKYAGQLIIKKLNGNPSVYDQIRNKYVKLTPEELVRQLIVFHLIEVMQYPKNKIAVEQSLKVNSLTKRCDILVYDFEFNPFLLIECKAHDVELDEKVFRQMAIYNIETQVPYFMLTNGIMTYVGKINYQSGTFDFEDRIPDWTVPL